ncbi:MAG TPA: pyridoxal phosphate-dependent aminotransferase [Thermodesulfobacteriaceae bacterium]|nr:pyridoxal phosphate-dependent aminotransferase [Thermodesulfobacteriaceae bacterium]
MSQAEGGVVSRKMAGFMERASWIRKMFEEGARLKEEFGSDRVCDFSLGNPDIDPPAVFQDSLQVMASDRSPGVHSYMPNAGIPDVRSRVAEAAGRDHQVDLSADEILMTCGAAGGLNIIFKALLNPGEEVITPAPYFVEYGFYADNHGGVLKTVGSKPDFSLDLDAIEKAFTEKTKVVLLNSPNNPSGVIYSEEELKALAELLSRAEKETGHPVFIVSDEPYRRLVYDNCAVPPVLRFYSNSIVTTSFSKDLSIPGERIGYVAVHPDAAEKAALLGALTLANRILGYVNAPALMQRVVGEVLEASVDIGIYSRRRELFADVLNDAGLEFAMPSGAFYFFPRSPIKDDTEFVRLLQEELILSVPGTGFGAPGYFRLAFCVDDGVIKRSRDGFRRAVEKAAGQGQGA